MNDTSNLNPFSRRDFLKTSGLTLGADNASGLSIPHVFAEGSEQLQVALIGCGGRGTGAAVNAMSQVGGPKLVAMADVFETKLSNSYNSLKAKFKDQVDVPDNRKFLGFDAYKNAMDCLKKGDIAIFTTPSLSVGCISNTPSKRDSMCSWKNQSPLTARLHAGCWSWPNRLLRRT